MVEPTVYFEIVIRARGETYEEARKVADFLLSESEDWMPENVRRLRTGVSYGELRQNGPAGWDELEASGKW